MYTLGTVRTDTCIRYHYTVLTAVEYLGGASDIDIGVVPNPTWSRRNVLVERCTGSGGAGKVLGAIITSSAHLSLARQDDPQ